MVWARLGRSPPPPPPPDPAHGTRERLIRSAVVVIPVEAVRVAGWAVSCPRARLPVEVDDLCVSVAFIVEAAEQLRRAPVCTDRINGVAGASVADPCDQTAIRRPCQLSARTDLSTWCQ